MIPSRREVMALGLGAAVLVSAPSAMALTESEARGVVQATIDDLLGLLAEQGSASAIAPRLKAIMELRANVRQLAKFSAGRVWLDMSKGQRGRYLEAFSHYISVVYARRFEEVAGNPQIQIGTVIDAGRKGFLVKTPVVPPQGETLDVEWLVSDRGGRVEIVDLVVEGISLAVTQREEISAILESQGGNIDGLVTRLESESAG